MASFTLVGVLITMVLVFVLSASSFIYFYTPSTLPEPCTPSNFSHHSTSSSSFSHPPPITKFVYIPTPCPEITNITSTVTTNVITNTTTNSTTNLTTNTTVIYVQKECKSPPNREGILLSAILGEKVDQQRGGHVKNDSFEYMEKYYNSVKRLGLKSVIFHDAVLSEEFVQLYGSENITFLRQNVSDPTLSNFGNYHLKFEFMYRYLQENYYPYVMATDLSDVVIIANVFKWMEGASDYYDLFVGSEIINAGSWGWVHDQMKGCFNNTFGLTGTVFYNAGILGGKHEHMLKLLEVFHNAFLKAPAKEICDAAVLFKYLYMDIEDKSRVWTGYPLHTDFNRGEVDMRFAFIKHK